MEGGGGGGVEELRKREFESGQMCEYISSHQR